MKPSFLPSTDPKKPLPTAKDGKSIPKSSKSSKKAKKSKKSVTSASESESESSSSHKRSKKSKKSKKPKKSKKSKKSISSSESESGEITSDASSVGSDADVELAAALEQRKNSDGVWGKFYSQLGSHDLETLAETEQIFGEVDQPIYEVVRAGGNVIVNFNKKVSGLRKKWGILKGSFDKKKHVKKAERKVVVTMIETSIKFIDDWIQDFNPNSYSKSAISAIIAKYEERLTKALLGARTCKTVITKLKGLVKSNSNLQHVSYSKLCFWNPQPRGFKNQQKSRKGYKNNYYGGGYNGGYGGYNGGYGGYNNYGGYNGYQDYGAGGSGGGSQGGNQTKNSGKGSGGSNANKNEGQGSSSRRF